jgi:aquaporin Z
MPLFKRATAEFFGTFWLVFGGCGSAVLAAAFPQLGIGFTGVALAFGLTVLTMAYTIGHISGCHLNPAVSVGLVVGKRFPASELLPYIVAQVAGAIAASGTLYLIASGKPGWGPVGGFASNGYGDHSPGSYSMLACFLIETLLTCFFLLVILGSTDERAPKGFAPISIGFCLTLIHLISIPVTNTSVNPARSTGPALL